MAVCAFFRTFAGDMATINEIQDEIIEEFGGFDDWMDKYQLLIDLGNEQDRRLSEPRMAGGRL